MTEAANRHAGRFLMTVERAVREANREAINPKLPPLKVEDVVPVMISVAKLRARYLHLAFQVSRDSGGKLPNAEQIAELKSVREAYQEMLAAAKELEHCVERGYVDIAEM